MNDLATSEIETLPGEVARIETGSGAIVATIADFRGRTVADFRKYFAREGGDLSPTPKGLAVAIDRLPALANLANDDRGAA